MAGMEAAIVGSRTDERVRAPPTVCVASDHQLTASSGHRSPLRTAHRQRLAIEAGVQLAERQQAMSLATPAVEQRGEGRSEPAALELGVQGEDVVRLALRQAQQLGDDRRLVAAVDAEQLVERGQ